MPRTMQASALCIILPHHSQILFYLMRRAEITGWRFDVSLLMGGEGQKLQERRPEVVNVIGYPIISR